MMNNYVIVLNEIDSENFESKRIAPAELPRKALSAYRLADSMQNQFHSITRAEHLEKSFNGLIYNRYFEDLHTGKSYEILISVFCTSSSAARLRKLLKSKRIV